MPVDVLNAQEARCTIDADVPDPVPPCIVLRASTACTSCLVRTSVPPSVPPVVDPLTHYSLPPLIHCAPDPANYEGEDDVRVITRLAALSLTVLLHMCENEPRPKLHVTQRSEGWQRSLARPDSSRPLTITWRGIQSRTNTARRGTFEHIEEDMNAHEEVNIRRLCGGMPTRISERIGSAKREIHQRVASTVPPLIEFPNGLTATRREENP